MATKVPGEGGLEKVVLKNDKVIIIHSTTWKVLGIVVGGILRFRSCPGCCARKCNAFQS